MSSRFASKSGRPPLCSASLALLGLLLSACGDTEQTPTAAPPPPAVSVVEVEPQDVTPSSQFVGRVVSIDQVDLRARVQGFLEQRLFTEGQKVEKGDLLYVIEQPPFQAQVDEAAADVARAEASVAETKATLERVQQASGSGAVSKQEVDQALANDQRAQAEVLAAKAQLEIAKLNLSYTEISAPIDGRIGFTNYTVGNLVGPDSGTLATIVSDDPIYVTFPVSSRIILEARQQAIAASQTSSSSAPSCPMARPTVIQARSTSSTSRPTRPPIRSRSAPSLPIPRAFWSMAGSSMSRSSRPSPKSVWSCRRRPCGGRKPSGRSRTSLSVGSACPGG